MAETAETAETAEMVETAERDGSPGGVARLEAAFGGLANSLGGTSWFDSVLESDEAGHVWLEAEALLDRLAFSRCLVPPSLGGTLGGADELMDAFRALYRRDPALGLGYAGTSFIACCNVWAVGTDDHKRRTAALLAQNRKIACSYYEPDHGNDLAAVEFRAASDSEGGALRLTGRKRVTSNIQDAAAAVVLARTADKAGSRSHSHLFLVKADLPEGAFRDADRHRSVGMRGVRLGGFEVADLLVPRSALMGRAGQAVETVMRSFQVTRTLLPGMFAGALDTGLRLAVRFSAGRRLHGRRLIDMAQTRHELASAYLDMLAIDGLTRLGARALHLLPGHCCLYAPAIKVAVPPLLIGAMDRLATLMGATFYRRSGPFGLFQKLLRDTKPVGFAHVGRPACQSTLFPLLHRLAKRAPAAAAALPPGTVDRTAKLEPLDFDDFALSPDAPDPVLALLDGPLPALEATLADLLRDAKAALLDGLRRLPVAEMTPAAPLAVYEMSEAYASLLCSAACVAWHEAGSRTLTAPLLNAIVRRQLVRLRRLPAASWRPAEIEAAFDALMICYNEELSFDLMSHPLSGWSER